MKKKFKTIFGSNLYAGPLDSRVTCKECRGDFLEKSWGPLGKIIVIPHIPRCVLRLKVGEIKLNHIGQYDKVYSNNCS